MLVFQQGIINNFIASFTGCTRQAGKISFFGAFSFAGNAFNRFHGLLTQRVVQV